MTSDAAGRPLTDALKEAFQTAPEEARRVLEAKLRKAAGLPSAGCTELDLYRGVPDGELVEPGGGGDLLLARIAQSYLLASSARWGGGGCGGGGPQWADGAAAVSSGCPLLDETLGGGYCRGHITEIAGPAGAGKTQLLLQAGLQCVCDALVREASTGYAGPPTFAVYLSFEPFPSARAHQLAVAMCDRHRAAGGVGLDPELVLSRLLITSTGALPLCVANLRRLLEQPLPPRAVALVCIDSIAAAAARTEEEFSSLSEGNVHRSLLLASVGGELKRLGCVHDFAVVASNHVVSTMEEARGAAGEPAVKPALGLSWAAVPNTHLLLTKAGNGSRVLRVTASPTLAPQCVGLVVRPDGVFGEEPVGAPG
ncbi:DNA repair protein RAD51-like protein 4 [Diplonema papillatum]|nr:DNA repair protein RAD51-like protein 4 [Diplonema papillatum]